MLLPNAVGLWVAVDHLLFRFFIHLSVRLPVSEIGLICGQSGPPRAVGKVALSYPRPCDVWGPAVAQKHEVYHKMRHTKNSIPPEVPDRMFPRARCGSRRACGQTLTKSRQNRCFCSADFLRWGHRKMSIQIIISCPLFGT